MQYTKQALGDTKRGRARVCPAQMSNTIYTHVRISSSKQQQHTTTPTKQPNACASNICTHKHARTQQPRRLHVMLLWMLLSGDDEELPNLTNHSLKHARAAPEHICAQQTIYYAEYCQTDRELGVRFVCVTPTCACKHICTYTAHDACIY